METLGVEIMFGGTLWDIPLLQLLKVNKFLGWKYKIISDTCFNLWMISYDSLYKNEAKNRKKIYKIYRKLLCKTCSRDSQMNFISIVLC